MQTIKLIFKETKTQIGYIESDSGTLLFIDGIWSNSFPSVNQQTILVDTETERTRFPVYAMMERGQRFIVIALDTDTTKIPMADKDQVIVDGSTLEFTDSNLQEYSSKE